MRRNLIIMHGQAYIRLPQQKLNPIIHDRVILSLFNIVWLTSMTSPQTLLRRSAILLALCNLIQLGSVVLVHHIILINICYLGQTVIRQFLRPLFYSRRLLNLFSWINLVLFCLNEAHELVYGV